jgi:hypothetical protein
MIGGIKIMPSHHWPTVQDGTKTIRFPAHPIIQWLSRWLPITPYVEGIYPKYRDADAIMDHSRGTLFCSYAQADLLRRELSR